MRRGIIPVVLALGLAGCAPKVPPAETAPGQTRVPSAITDVALATPETGYAVDSAGSIYKSDDGGLRWTELFHDPSASLQQVQFRDAQDGFAIGFTRCADICPALYTTQDGGEHWNLIKPSLPPDFNEVWGGTTVFPTATEPPAASASSTPSSA